MENQSLENDLVCSICLDNIELDNINITETTCNHIFHNECLNLWLNNHSTCPCCRTTINDLDNNDYDGLPDLEPIHNTDNENIYNFIINNISTNDNNIINNDNLANNLLYKNINNFLTNNFINNNENLINYMIDANMNNIMINEIINNNHNNINFINNINNIYFEPLQ